MLTIGGSKRWMLRVTPRGVPDVWQIKGLFRGVLEVWQALELPGVFSDLWQPKELGNRGQGIGVRPRKESKDRRGRSLANTGKISIEIPLLSSHFLGIIRMERQVVGKRGPSARGLAPRQERGRQDDHAHRMVSLQVGKLEG